jgi:hypothetical protein
VFTTALSEVVADMGSNFDVLWAFYEPDPDKIRKNSSGLLDKLAPGFGRGRVVPYRGIDTHCFLTELATRIPAAAIPATSSVVDLTAILSVGSVTAIPIPPSPPPTATGAGMKPERELATRFVALPFVVRTRILTELGLVEIGETPATDPAFFIQCFKRAKERGALADLWTKVANHHASQMDPNPFATS